MSIKLGYDAAGRPLYLSDEDRKTHMHVIGSSGSGKSKFLESMIREDLHNRQGFCLIDPHGTLYHDVLGYCAHWVMERDIILLDLSQPESIVGFHPFTRASQGDVSVQVDNRINATLHAWDVENTDETPTLARTLRLIYTALIERSLPFSHAQHLIDFHAGEIRASMIEGISSPLIRKEWLELQALNARDWRSEVLSAKNRLFRLLTSTTLARFFNSPGKPLDLADAMNSGKILLVNLAPSDYLSSENARVFGALLVNEFFEVARRRRGKEGKPPKPYYLYLDEFQTFVSLDITAMLDQVRKFGLFAVLAHQRFGQLDADLADAVAANCRIKAVFGGLPIESAKMMAQELFIGELDPKKIKVAIYQTKFWPQYARDKVYTDSTSLGHSEGSGQNLSSGSTSSAASGGYFQPGDWFSSDTLVQTSKITSSGTNEISGHHSSETEFSGTAESVADVPIMIPVPFRELSSVQYYSTEEQLTEMTAALKEQFGRHCFIKIQYQKTQPMLVPFVKYHHTPYENFQWYRDRLCKACSSMPARDVDAAIAMREAELHTANAKPAQAPKKKKSENSWADFLGKE